MSPPEIKVAQGCFGAGYFIILAKIAWWVAFERTDPTFQRALFTALLFAATGVLWFASSTFAASKSSLQDMEMLSVNALATNITYPKGTKVGDIEWMDGFIDVRLTIEDISDSPIQNVNLTVEVLDENGALFAMGQMGGIPGVEFHPPELPDIGIQLIGKDGQTSTVTARDLFAMAAQGKTMPSMGKQYKLFCPRLIPKAPLRLVVATGDDKGELTNNLRIFGTYETMPSEGSRLVKIDKTAHVRH